MGRVEIYQQAHGGARQVQYFDKARMEITDWKRDRANPWFVTNGLLVREMIEGRVQIGDSEFMHGLPPRSASPEMPADAAGADLRQPAKTAWTCA